MAGALISQVSKYEHVGMTRDIRVGQEDCKSLAAESGTWDQCHWNADSYRYFAEDPDNYNDHEDPTVPENVPWDLGSNM